MPIATIQLPDGRTADVEVPAGMAPQDMESQIQQMYDAGEFGAPGTSKDVAAAAQGAGIDPATIGRAAKEAAKIGGRGLYEAAMGIPNLTGQLAEWMIPQSLKAKGERPDLGLAMPSRAGLERALVPETKAGRSASNILAAALSARMGGGGLKPAEEVTKQALGFMTRAGAASGVGGELAGLASNDNPWARVAGSLATGGVYGLGEGGVRGLISAIQGRGKRMTTAKKVVEGLSEEDIMRSVAAQQTAKAQGVDVTPGQTLPGTNVPAFEQFATSQSPGVGLTNIFRRQPEQVTTMAQRFEQGVPGKALPASPLNTQARQAATEALKNARGYRSATTRPLYTGELSPEGAKGLQKTIRQEIKKLPTELDDVKALQKLRLALTNKVVKKQPDGTMKVTREPLTKTQEINKAFRSVKNSLAKPGEGGKQFSKEVRNSVERVIGKLKEQIGQELPEYAKGDETFAAISRRLVNPMKEGPAGKIAGVTEYVPGQASAQNYLTRLFDKGGSGKGASEIELARQQLLRAGDQGKVAFDDTFKAWLADGLSDAMKYEKGGVSPEVAKSIHAKFFGTEAKRQAFRDGLRGVAKNNGMDVDATIKGMENMVRTIEMAAARPGAPGLSGGEIASSADTIAKQISGFTFLLPARGALRFINNRLKADALGFVSDTLSTPGGISTLYKMANAQPGSAAAQTILGDFAATFVQPELAKPKEER